MLENELDLNSLFGMTFEQAREALDKHGLTDYDFDTATSSLRLRYWTPNPWTKHEVVIMPLAL